MPNPPFLCRAIHYSCFRERGEVEHISQEATLRPLKPLMDVGAKRKGMATGMSDQVPLTFDDIAVYFSLEEWRKLEDWQKELYKTTMQENYEALASIGFPIKKPDVVSRIEQGEEPWVKEDATSSIPGTSTILAVLERMERRMARIEHQQMFVLTRLFQHLQPAIPEREQDPTPSLTDLGKKKRTIQEMMGRQPGSILPSNEFKKVRRVMLGRQKRVKLQKPSACIEPLQRGIVVKKEEEVSQSIMDKTCHDKMEHSKINYGSIDKGSVSHNSIDLNKMDSHSKMDHSSTEQNIMSHSSLGCNTMGSSSIDHTTKGFDAKPFNIKDHNSTRFISKGRSSIKCNNKIHNSIDNLIKGHSFKAHNMKSHNPISQNNMGLNSTENNSRYHSCMGRKFLGYTSVGHSVKGHSSTYNTTIAHNFMNHSTKSFSPIAHKIISHSSKNQDDIDCSSIATIGGSSIEHSSSIEHKNVGHISINHNSVNHSSMIHSSVDNRNTELNNMAQSPTIQKNFKKEKEEHSVHVPLGNDDRSVKIGPSLLYRSRCAQTEVLLPQQDSTTDISPLREDFPVINEAPQKTATSVIADITRISAKLKWPSQKKPSKLGIKASLAYRMNRICLPDIEMCKVSKERVRDLYIGSQGSLLRFAGWIFRSLVPLQTYKQWCHVANFTGTNGKMAIPNNVKSKLMELVEENYGTTNMREKQQIRDGVNNQLRNPRKTDFHPGL